MSQLPENLRTCFWDTDFDNLDKDDNMIYIIARLYTQGGIEGIHWVENNYTAEEISRAAKIKRDLNPTVANYLQKKYGLNREDMAYYRLRPKNSDWRF